MPLSLVLNATEEPLSVVSARRAAILVFSERADTVYPSGKVLRSERLDLEVPSVLRLRKYVQIPYFRRSSISRRGVLARDGHNCQYCGRHADSVDHIRPRSRGGRHTWDNVVAACRRCNARKKDRLPSEAGMRLSRPPQPPSRSVLIMLKAGEVPEHWNAYLEVVQPLSA